jgi:DNA repair protein RecO (recombination protein O)
LSILELQVTDRDNKSLQQINEVSMHKPTFELLSNPVKSSIAIFLNEVLHRSIEVNYHNEVLYDFLENAIQLLDSCSNVKNFHLWFMLELSKYFGFYPMKKSELCSAKFQFELESGTFTDIGGCSGAFIDVSAAAVLDEVLGMKFDKLSSLIISSFDRKALLHGLVDYFIIHVPSLKRVSSLEVLETVFEF